MKKIIITLVLFGLTACFSRSVPSNFYNVVSMPDSSIKINNRKKIKIAIDLVAIPDYINRAQIVTFKEDESKLNVSERNRWAEPLSRSMQRVIADNMFYYLKNSNVVPLNSSRSNFDYTVMINVNRFYGSFNNKALLDAWWTVNDRNNNVILQERSKIEVEVGDGYEDLVNRQSELINKLSIEIADRINSL